MSGDGPIYHKYDVERTDGAEHNPESKHFGGCFLFVLDLDHDPMAAAAIFAYADAAEATHPQLAQALRDEMTNRGHVAEPSALSAHLARLVVVPTADAHQVGVHDVVVDPATNDECRSASALLCLLRGS